jgi:uncharacterized protein (TIGR02147 family)
MNDLFSHRDYKAYLKKRIESEKSRAYKSRLATAMGTPASFISQVLHTHVELSYEHGFKLSRFWEFSPDEQEYFLTLVQLARAGAKELREFLEAKLDDLREKNKDLSQRFQQPAISTTEEQWTYYTTWHFAAVHLLTTIPSMQKPEAMARRLELPLQQIEFALNSLQRMGLVEKKADRWVSTKKSLHLSRNSPASAANHLIWRQRAIQHIYQDKDPDLHYTTLHTLSKQDAEQLRTMLLECIEKMRALVGPSKEEELVCVCVDYFGV